MLQAYWLLAKGNPSIVPVPVKQLWRMWANKSQEPANIIITQQWGKYFNEFLMEVHQYVSPIRLSYVVCKNGKTPVLEPGKLW